VRTVFMGSPEFPVPSLRAIAEAGYNVVRVYTQPDRPAGRGRKLVPPPVKVAAESLGIPVYQPERLRQNEAMVQLRELEPNLIVVAAYGQILRPEVVNLPQFGVINVHASLLPRHRGASAIAAAVLAGDAQTGVSVMRIDAGLDTGPVLVRRSTPIQEGDTAGTLTERLAVLGAGLLVEILPGWLAGEVQAVPQDESQATYAPLLSKDDATIDWTKPAEVLAREVRAYNPWPLCSTHLNGEQVQILQGLALPGLVPGDSGPPGTVVALTGLENALPSAARSLAGIAIVTGNGLLVPLALRRAGRNVTTGAEFARGVRGLIGARFW